MSTVDKILTSWKKKVYKPHYWFQGEEDYDIDVLVQYAEQHILTDEEASFNLRIFYGKDAHWADVINACRSHPMFGNLQLVILKEAQHMKDIELLEPYFLNSLASTIFIVAYKSKSLDKRKSFYKSVAKVAEIVDSAKLKNDSQVIDWIESYAQQKGFAINAKASALILEHIGNDLSRISNEIDKLTLNIKGAKKIDESAIEKFIGISKEYNVFEFQSAMLNKNMKKAISIVQYFDANPKAGPIQLVLPILYSFFSKVYAAHNVLSSSPNALQSTLGLNYYSANDVKQALSKYSFEDTEKIILLLHQYNLKGVGVGDVGTSDASLLKELVSKIMLG